MTACTLGIACVGEFENGRGDFYDQESTNGKTILVRFLHLGHQARQGAIRAGISEDGGKTWETQLGQQIYAARTVAH